MREIQASQAEADLADPLDEVEGGETLFITRHGKPIARLVPETDRRQAEIVEALREIENLRQATGKIFLEQIVSGRHEGHKY